MLDTVQNKNYFRVLCFMKHYYASRCKQHYFFSVKILQTVLICETSAFGDEQRRIFRIIQRFGKHCSCSSPKAHLCIELQPRKPKDKNYLYNTRIKCNTSLTVLVPHIL
jgi:hypothetical protein